MWISTIIGSILFKITSSFFIFIFMTPSANNKLRVVYVSQEHIHKWNLYDTKEILHTLLTFLFSDFKWIFSSVTLGSTLMNYKLEFETMEIIQISHWTFDIYVSLLIQRKRILLIRSNKDSISLSEEIIIFFLTFKGGLYFLLYFKRYWSISQSRDGKSILLNKRRYSFKTISYARVTSSLRTCIY